MLAFSPMPALFESRLLLDFLLVPFTALVLLFTIESARRRPIFSLVLGLSAGLFAVTRPNILAVFPVLLGWLFFASEGGNRVRFERIAFALCGAILIIAPVTIHNLSYGSRSLIATQGGINLYLGNNPETDGITPVLPGFGGDWTLDEAWRTAEIEAGRPLDADKLDRYYRRKAFDFFKGDPRRAAGLMFRKVLLLASGLEHGNNGSPEFFKRFSPALRSPFGWRFLLPAALFIAPLIRWNRQRALLALFFLAYSATVVLFFVNARFRLPLLVPLICLIAAAASGEPFVKSRLRIVSSVALLIAGIAVCCAFPAGRLGDRGLAESYFALGNLHLRGGAVESADSLYSLALETSPEIDRANLNRGIVAFRRGDYRTARDFFEREAKSGKRALALSNLGVLARLEADTAAALDYGARSIEAGSFESAPRVNFAQSLLEFGQPDSALRVAKAGLSADSLELRLLLLAGAAAMKLGMADSAEEFLSRAASDSSDPAIVRYELAGRYSQESAGAEPSSSLRARALHNLGLICLARGRTDSALARFQAAIELSPRFSESYLALGTLHENLGRPDSALKYLARSLELGSNSAELYYNLGLVRAQLGDFRAARNDFERALQRDSSFSAATEKIELIEKLRSEGKISLE